MGRIRRLLAALLVGVALMPTLAPLRLFPRQNLGGLFPRETIRPDASTGSTTAGQDGTAFLPDELTGARLVVRAAFGADPTTPPGSWRYYDITSDVLQDNGRTISMRVGRINWKTSSQPAVLTLGLKNPTGVYTATNVLSPWWPYLTQGVPIQIQVWFAGQYWTRFEGEAVGFKPVLDSTGNYSTVVLTANGTLRRIGGGNAQLPPLRSALYRAISSTSPAPVAWWPMEDGFGATRALSGLPGGAPLAVSSGTVTFGAIGPAGAASAVDFSAVGTLSGPVPATGFNHTMRIEFAVKFPTILAGQICDAITVNFGSPGNVLAVRIVGAPSGEGALQYIMFFTDGTSAQFVFTGGDIDDGQWHWVQLDLTQSGSNVNEVFRLDGVEISSGPHTGATLGPAVSVEIDPLPQQNSLYPSIDHLVVWYTLPSDYLATYQAATGHTGETVSARLARLCAEESIPFTAAGGWTDDTLMGPQGVDTLINLLRECESTGAGLLYDGPGVPGLTYQPLRARYRAPALLALDASAGQVQPPFGMEDDDFERLNLSTVVNRDGATVTYEATDGPLGTGRVPVYGGSPPVRPNYYSSALLPLRAGWEARKGTTEGFRYPSLAINLRKLPSKVLAWLQAMPGTPVAITPPYAGVLPTDDLYQVVEGWQEDLAKKVWTATLFTSRGDPYLVEVVGAARVDTAGSTIAATAAAGSGSLSVASSGTVWSTVAANYPNDFYMAGLRVTVTGVSGATSPQTFTVTAADVLKQLNPGDTVRLWSRTYPAL